MRIAVPDIISPSYFPAEAAVVLGCFAEQGIQAEVELISPVEKAYAALRGGEIEIVAGSAHSALSAFPRWQGVKLLCAQSQGMYWFLVMRADIGASRGDVSCVKGQQIGAAPWVGMGLRRLLIAAGVDTERDDVTIAPIPAALPPALISVSPPPAPSNKELWTVSGPTAWAPRSRCARASVHLSSMSVAATVRALPLTTRCRRLRPPTPFIARRPQEAAASVRAVVEAQQILKRDVARSLEVGQRLFPNEADHIVELVRRDLPFYSAGLTEDFIAGMNRFARDLGILDVDAAYGAVVAEQFRDEWK